MLLSANYLFFFPTSGHFGKEIVVFKGTIFLRVVQLIKTAVSQAFD